MLTLPQNALTRYGVAVLTSGLALLVTSQVPLLAERTPFAFFFAAVIFTAWFGGRMPGLVALVLSAILSIYFIISPVGSFVGDLSGFFPLTTFVGISLVLVLLTSTLGYHKRSVGESEERYRYLFENNPLPMWVFDLGTLEFLAVNTSAIRHYGYSRDEFMSMTIMDIRPTNSVPTLLNEVAANNNDLKSVGIWKHVKKDGTVIDAEIMSYTLQFEGRSARLVLAIDVTERERIAVAIRDSEERLLQVFGHCPVAVLIQKWNDGTFVEVNHEFTKLTGWTRDEVIGRTSTSLKMIDTNSMSGLREQLQEKKSIVDTEVLIKTRDGDTRNVIMGTVKADMQGKAHAITTLVDVTQRRRAEIERRTTEQRYRTLFDYSPDGILIADAESNYVDANDTMCKLLGYEKSELVGLHAADIVVPEEIPHIDEALAVINAKFAYYREWQFRRKDGTVFAGEVIATSMPDGNLLAVIRDITERKRAEEALRTSEERYRDLVENAIDIIYTHDLDGNYISVNSAAERITGYSRVEALSMNLSQIVAPEYLDKARRMVAEKLTGNEMTAYEIEILAKDGRRIAVEINTRIIHGNGSPVRVQGIARDVTERKLLEDQFRHGQKMEAVGMLAGGVAHDFNNLLTAIGGYSELTLRRMTDEDPLRQNIEEIKKASDRAGSLTAQLLAFSRKQVLQPSVLDLNIVVSDLEKMLKRIIGGNIDFRSVIEKDLGSVRADPGQIEQIIVNLVVNAGDAMPKGGRLTVETKNVILDEEYGRNHAAVEPGPFVMLAVSDTGFGMDEKTQERIFEPFFTTKESGQGTGLGLSTVYGIVKQSGGNIWVYSEVGRGTTVKIYLPRVDEAAIQRKEIAKEKRNLHGSETILLVEDEEAVMKLTHSVLELYGYRVLAATNGDDALVVSSGYDDPIHLLLTDVIMPGMNGRELADQLFWVRPETRVLYMSGYTDSAIENQGVLESGASFIQKPFGTETMARKVREVLSSPK